MGRKNLYNQWKKLDMILAAVRSKHWSEYSSNHGKSLQSVVFNLNTQEKKSSLQKKLIEDLADMQSANSKNDDIDLSINSMNNDI